MILILGHKGRQGRRFAACLDYLKEEWVGRDVGEGGVEHLLTVVHPTIIATPTYSHLSDITLLHSCKKILCEKPIAKNIALFDFLPPKERVDIRMCCNWQFAINMVLTAAQDIMVRGETEIEYDCYNTGKDGTAWDCIQLIHLAGPKNITIRTESPVMRCFVKTKKNPEGYEITTRHIEESYVAMLSAWIHYPTQLWGVEESLQAHREVLEYIQLHPEHG